MLIESRTLGFLRLFIVYVRILGFGRCLDFDFKCFAKRLVKTSSGHDVLLRELVEHERLNADLDLFLDPCVPLAAVW